jgi:hypothetical protein
LTLSLPWLSFTLRVFLGATAGFDFWRILLQLRMDRGGQAQARGVEESRGEHLGTKLQELEGRIVQGMKKPVNPEKDSPSQLASPRLTYSEKTTDSMGK